MWPFFFPFLVLATPRRSDDATDADVRQSVQDVETAETTTDSAQARQKITAAKQRAEAVAAETGHEGDPGALRGPEIACIGEPGQMIFAPMADVSLHKFANATVAGLDNTGRWIATDAAVDIEVMQ